MKKILLLFMLLAQSACAGNIEVRLLKNYEGMDEEFTPYVQEFIYASEGKVSKRDFEGFTIGFRDYKGTSIVGTCHPMAYEVDISRSWWKYNMSQSKRIELVFHELGHCVLHRGHTKKPTGDGWLEFFERFGFKIGLFEEKGLLPDGCPASFMHPKTLYEDCINKHFSYYIKELFKGKRKNYVERMSKSPYRDPAHEVKCDKEPKVINETKTWNKKDENTLKNAKRRCLKSYHSCLGTFWKKGHGNYHALCE